MTKKTLNQNSKFINDLINTVSPDLKFSSKPINRFKKIQEKKQISLKNKKDQLIKLREDINSIENCNLKENSKNLIFGEGDLSNQIMIIGEAPGPNEENDGLPFQGEVGSLLNKMFLAININREKLYLTYAINYRPPQDRKPTSYEIKRYSHFLKEHISIINPKIIILMGATAMEAIMGPNKKISQERGKWKEIILKNNTFPLIITYSPSYLLRFPENKKYSWSDLKNLKQKIIELDINI
tara:strand:- start:794 stop:1513 length:720 start_codon:yes stop_codon:yes gene_type:complete